MGWVQTARVVRVWPPAARGGGPPLARQLDLVLLHPGGSISEVADRLWYPIWDSGLRLDHSVRTVAEARRVAAADIKTLITYVLGLK